LDETSIVRLKGARLVGLDWGTSALRAYLFGGNGDILAERSAPSGVLHLDRFLPTDAAHARRETLFEAALDDVCRDWPATIVSQLPVLACGMVGSTVGWKEAAYLQTPAGTNELAKALTSVKRANGSVVQIVPGVCSYGVAGASLPEIMRGEETQITGLLSAPKAANMANNDDLLIGLPGTHSKWAQVREDRIVSFTTFVTGELYALLTNHSVVAKTETKSPHLEEAAFQAGLRLGQSESGEAAGGLLSSIFSTRSRKILGELKQEEQPDYLSGLLIGAELAGVHRVLAREKRKPADFAAVVLAGERGLCARYQSACRTVQWPRTEIAENATARGLWSVARQAGLVG
jgi:2-dehydro-3-deoxygalactonokinase